MINWDKLHSDRMLTGHYKGRPVWSNGYILEFAPPPSELGSTWNELRESVVATILLGAQPTKAHTIIGMALANPDDAYLFFRAGKIYGQVNRFYWGYFQERYPDMEAFASDAEAILQIKAKGELVGLMVSWWASSCP